jgi:hypothetical protein
MYGNSTTNDPGEIALYYEQQKAKEFGATIGLELAGTDKGPKKSVNKKKPSVPREGDRNKKGDIYSADLHQYLPTNVYLRIHKAILDARKAEQMSPGEKAMGEMGTLLAQGGTSAIVGGILYGTGTQFLAWLLNAEVTSPTLKPNKMGDAIGWGEGSFPGDVQQTEQLTESLTAGRVKLMQEKGLTKDFVESNLQQYNRAIQAGGAKARNPQLIPRKALMEKILQLWSK